MTLQPWQEKLLADAFRAAKDAISTNGAPDVVVTAAVHHLLNGLHADAQPSAEEWDKVPEELVALADQHGYIIWTEIFEGVLELHLMEKLSSGSPCSALVNVNLAGYDDVKLPTVGDLLNLLATERQFVRSLEAASPKYHRDLLKELRLHGFLVEA